MYRIAGERSLPTRDPNLVTRKYVDVPAAYVAAALEDRVRSLAARLSATPTTSPPSRQAPPPRHGHSR